MTINMLKVMEVVLILTLKCDDFRTRIHDRGLGRDLLPCNGVASGHINSGDLLYACEVTIIIGENGG